MLAILAILVAGLSGYTLSSIMAWPAAAIALTSVSWAQNHTLIRQGLDAGLDEQVGYTLT